MYLVAHRLQSSLVCARPIELTSRAQIVLNAVTNAVKYTPPHAHAGVAVTARLGPAAASLLVEVADCGPGLRGQTLSQLVEEFGGNGSAQVRRTRCDVIWTRCVIFDGCCVKHTKARKSAGGAIRSSGMGIPICVRLAELMGGAVGLADREDGPGARFTLTLPLAYAEQQQRATSAGGVRVAVARDQPASARPHLLPITAAAAVPQESSGARSSSGKRSSATVAPSPMRAIHGTRVLAVDDSPANLRFMVFVLKRLGCAVGTCSDGDEVLAALAAAIAAGAPYDVVLMDLYMDRLNGDGALAALRAAGHTVPVVLCTANATSGDVERYRALGFCGQLGKPYSSEQLHAAIVAAKVWSRRV